MKKLILTITAALIGIAVIDSSLPKVELATGTAKKASKAHGAADV